MWGLRLPTRCRRVPTPAAVAKGGSLRGASGVSAARSCWRWREPCPGALRHCSHAALHKREGARSEVPAASALPAARGKAVHGCTAMGLPPPPNGRALCDRACLRSLVLR